ncbi:MULTISPECIES: hypothetical protein [Enterobacterales]|jgi:hypothetical protein|uniref:hypothetical protein n=1 Tax=Enterobacterales TaxID=91347 RepID=UPI0007C42F98|nr:MULTISPECIES: hypothetical protein [Enterobacterales]EAA2741790.1 hypothetical protein [Salmonella enterica subsp. enterica serovar Infantis]EBS0968497.1 hypothetical protein [Salmonella enterica subsp. enterica serovar Enteritidis]EBT8578941.1 hypothetical protein [Salmonella enterica]EBW4953277.1 hypothetical protein [Salmonella enterica subsp. enterica serovar Hadar]EGT5763790.1 hypothetical protein [Cronobacter sakazakii]EJU1826516.1 hypothetical protein [Salmonella enterica subsp. ent
MNVFKSRRRLSRDNTKLVNVGFTEEQMNKMSMSFKNRSLAMSCLSKWIVEDLIKRNKTLDIEFKDGEYSFKERDFKNSTINLISKDYTNENLNKRNVVIDKDTIDVVLNNSSKNSLYRLLPALTLYAIEKLYKENKVFMQDNNKDINIYIKTN